MKYYSATDVLLLANQLNAPAVWDQSDLDAWATTEGVSPTLFDENTDNIKNPDQELRKELVTLFKDKSLTTDIIDFASATFDYIKNGPILP